jgi:hypothetical protein
MSRLDEALERLERAVTRLEAAGRGDGGEGAVGRWTAESDAETSQLRASAGEIAARVDGALARIGRALGGEG